MSSPLTTQPEFDAVAEAIRSHDRFLVTTHENPDGDALGSLLAMKLTLDQLGKDSVMFLGGEAPLPREYAWMPFGDLRRQAPDDTSERVLLALDCANESRLGPDPEVLVTAPLVVNVDHHHDNSLFGGINLIVADASSTAEIVRDIVERHEPVLGRKRRAAGDVHHRVLAQGVERELRGQDRAERVPVWVLVGDQQEAVVVAQRVRDGAQITRGRLGRAHR